MLELLWPLIALALAAALQPLQVTAMLVLLQTNGGKRNGTAFLGGMIAFRLVLALIFWQLMSRLEAHIESGGGDFSILTGTVMLVLGLLLMIMAFRKAFSVPHEDHEAASWMDKLDAITPGRAALLGAAFLALDPKDWLIDISAIDLIAAADISLAESGLAYLFYILMAQGLLLVLLIFSLGFPVKAQIILGRFSAWLSAHERSIEIWTALLFGLLFLFAGLEYIGVFS